MVLRKPVPGAQSVPNPQSELSPPHNPNNPYANHTTPPYPTSTTPARAPPAIPHAQPDHDDYFKVEAELPRTGDAADEPEERDWWDESDDEDDLAANPPLQPGKAEAQTQAHPPVHISQPLPDPLRIGHAPATQSTSTRNSAELSNLGIGKLSINELNAKPLHDYTTYDNSEESGQDYKTYSRFGQTNNLHKEDLESPASAWADTQLPRKPSTGLAQYGPPSVLQYGSPGLPQYAPSSQPLAPQISNTSATADLGPTRPVTQSNRSSEQAGLIPVQVEDPWKDQAQASSNVAAPLPPALTSQAFEAASSGAANPWSGQTSENQRAPQPTLPKLDMPPPLPDRTASGSETPQTKARRQRNEFYQIKSVRWHDASSRQNPRTSPVLVQNANGPCPLLALVNALSLTTPAGEHTALLETLSNREQVSLGLLLDAVFDELMSGRRGDAVQELPDIGDLYSFLVTLHTGMNVNPRFVDAKDSDEVHPGTFETTKEMRLYSTFNIPLIHGWTPNPDSAAFASFKRQPIAQTYDDAQSMQFHAEELEAKFHSQGLSDEEQDIFMDVTAIKEFLTTYPTQLSEYGLETMKQWVKPGQVVILFRNDHFSTLYKQPDNGRLLTLVTDAGYSTHDEIVWESLADTSGMYSELFSGDFRSVSHASGGAHLGPSTVSIGEGEWTTVTSKNPRRNQSTTSNSDAAASGLDDFEPPPLARSNTEQEDHDLALALQLQEEEEAAQRSSQASRARENAATERFLSQESARQPNPSSTNQRRTPSGQQNTSGRSSNSGASNSQSQSRPPQPPRPGVSRPTNAEEGYDSDGMAPPPYTPVSPNPQPPRAKEFRPPMNTMPTEYTRRRQSLFTTESQPGSPSSPSGGRRRLSRQQVAAGTGTRPGFNVTGVPTEVEQGDGGEGKCVVM